MKMNRLLSLSIAALLAVGCASDDKDEAKYQELDFASAPIAVRLGVEKAFPNAKVQEIEKETYPDGTVHYEVELTTADGVKKEVEFTPDGELLDEHD